MSSFIVVTFIGGMFVGSLFGVLTMCMLALSSTEEG